MDQMREIETNINFMLHTEGERKFYTIIWSIPRFLNLLQNKTTRVLRKDIKDQPCCRLRLKMQFLGVHNGMIEIYYLSPDPVYPSVLNICLNKVNSKQFEERSIPINNFLPVKANKWQYIATIYKRDLTGGERRDIFHGNDCLQLKFKFIVSNDIKVEHTNVPEAQLSNDFEILLNNGLFSDVVMKSIEGTEFKVHKAVLASRSVVLKAHFEHNTTECHTNIVESPLEEEVLNEVLTFIYSDKAPSVDDIPEKLLAAADYYQLSKLKSLCEEALQKKLTVENAIETLQLAEMHSAKILKKLTLEFIKDRRSKIITETEGWVKVKSVDLIKTICEYIMNDVVDTD